ncbi:hypothetical protein [Desulfovibrio porci]|uniref:hypothetical protein n=1 Tax=Desulfovibrio porci TaxID=2605782 RepID=UPI002A7EDC68|nr:hypothetical protein [Desulfovibrio porci]MDY3810613.1 hypothetical protein [Desulfovibrio porci]
MVSNSFLRCFLLLMAVSLATGCSSYQPTKNAWKSTKGFWNTYVSPPASVDYEEKGDISPRALALTNSMMGIDVELGRLERVMLNADKPPTREWITTFFASFPWISGFAGVKYDGTILGQEPATSMKELDFIPLLYEDKKQNSRALRADVQNTPLGPEIMLAAPLYDGVDFLGVVAAYFDMRALMQYSSSPENMVILTPQALLWPGKYDFAATPLAGVNWSEVVSKSSSGTCTNATGSFYYMVRYLGNLPLVFAVVESGTFPEGKGDLEQGLPFFPKEREKLPPPPQPERKEKTDVAGAPNFGTPSGEDVPAASMGAPGEPSGTDGRPDNEIQPGSHDSMLLKGKTSEKQRVQERALEGENVPVERVQRPRKAVPQQPRRSAPPVDLVPDADMPALPGGRPSPFGPRKEAPVIKRPSPFGPRTDSPDASAQEQTAPATQRETPADAPKQEATPAASPASEADTAPEQTPATEKAGEPQTPATLPGGRPSPFGPRD